MATLFKYFLIGLLATSLAIAPCRATDWISNGESGSSVRGKLNSVPNKGNVGQLTSGGIPLDIDLSKNVTAVTSGGTAGNETVNVPNFALPVDAYTNPSLIGTRYIVFLAVRSNPSDVVKVTINGGDAIRSAFPAGQNAGEVIGAAVTLDYVGATAVFVWQGYGWKLDNTAGDNSASFVANVGAVPITRGGTNIGSIPLWNTDGGGPNYDSANDPGVVAGLDAVTTGSGTPSVNPYCWATEITTGGTGGVENLTLDVVFYPQRWLGVRHVIYLKTKTNPGDSVSLQVTNLRSSTGSALTSVVFDTEGQTLIIEWWSATKWWVVRGTAVITP